MNTYFMGGDLNSQVTIIGINNTKSEYQDMINQYKARGGKVTYCAQGQRTTNTAIPSYTTCKEETEASNRGAKGYAVFDIAQGAEPTDPEAYFDKKEPNK
jgi:hypothetical protein